MTIDNIIVLLYLISILVIGIYYRSRLRGFANYATVQDKIKNSRILLVATIFTSSVGGATTLGIAEKAFSGDLSYSYGLILSLPVDILIAIYLVPQITKHYGAESVGDIMEKYYGKTGRFIAGITTIMVSIGFVAAQISVSGYIFQYILKINYLEGTLLSYGIVIIYTTIGGLQSIMFTNLLQFFAMIIALPIIAICGLNKIGISDFINQLPIEKVYFIHHNNFASELFINTITAMLGFYVMNLYPIFIQRALINNNAKKTSNAIYIKSSIYAIFLIFITLNGLIAYNLYPDYSSNLALPHLIDQIVPSGLQGFVIIGLLASVMSTADSDLNVTSIALVKDLLTPIFKIQNQKKLLLITRITNVVIGSFAIIIALKFDNVIDLVVFITGSWGPIILVPLIFAFFNITITQRMMILCGLSGASSFFIWTYFFASNFRLKGVFIGTMCSLLVLLQNSKLIGSDLIRYHLENAPSLPGVYKMLKADRQVIYVGKAKNLKKRLTNYIKTDLDNKTILMISLTHYLEYNVTNSEVEALLLEAQLIKKFQPKFNVLLKDDKSFPYIKLRLDVDYPQLIKYRGKNLSGGEFFGPFVSSEQVDTTLKELQKIFKLRSCSDNYFNNRKRPCLQYQIGRCSAPCVEKISKENYSELVCQVKNFLNGKTKELQKTLSHKMEELSIQLRFEEAAEIRDRIKALSYIQLKSTLSSNSIKNADVIAIVEKNNCYCIQLFVYRFGQSYGNIAYFPFHTDGSNKSEILTQFINQFYQNAQIPNEIIINHPIIDLELVTKAIRQLSGNIKFNIRLYSNDLENGDNKQGVSERSVDEVCKYANPPKFCGANSSKHSSIRLLENAEFNAQLSLNQHLKQFAKNQIIFQQIQQLFDLPTIPDRIEVYDNSHIMGTFAVGSMIVANQSGFDKKEYRIFNISIPQGNSQGDDYEMLRIVLTRRFTRLKKEHLPNEHASTNFSSIDYKTLMIIDGGKGHLSVVQKIMKEFDLKIPVVCMSKGPDRNAGCEQFHMPNKEAFTIDKSLPVMKYLQILRDEAHNFAIKNHRLRRSKAIKVSSLDDISSIGVTRKKALLHYFGSYKAICDATIDELSKVNGISQTLAKNIFTSLHNK